MSTCSRRCALALAVALLAVVGGCASYGRCGSRECPEETSIRTEVEALFSRYPELRPPNELYVQVHGTRVTLSGQVNSEYERRLAESVAHQAKGVGEVVNLVGLTYAGR